MDLHQRKPSKTSSSYDIIHSSLTSAKPQKRWSLACNAVYFIVSLSRKVLPKDTHLLTRIIRSPSYVVLDINIDREPPVSFSIDQKSLTSMTREKDIESLIHFGRVKHLALALGINPAIGVTTNNNDLMIERKAVFGSNIYLKSARKSFLSFVIEAMKDTTIIILVCCAVLSLGFGIKQKGPAEGWYDGGSIIIAIFLVVSVSSLSNFKQSRQFKKLSDESNNIRVEALRDGFRQHISIFDVVVGDIVFLKIGDQIPADGLFLDGHSLKVDESSMTGESEHIEVNDENNPFLFSGTKVIDGYGRMMVTSVGMNTTWGEIMSSITRDLDEETPLQARLNKLTSCIGKVGLLVASLVLVVMLIRYFTGHTRDEYGNREYNGRKTETNEVINAIINIVSAAVTIVVVAIPEGLPLAVTLTLAYSMKKMMSDNAMVRKLSACETMGSATTICTDKTGTLTLNMMSVTEFWQGKEAIKKPMNMGINVHELLQQAVGLNTSGGVCQLASMSVPEISGSPTEKAILSWAVFDLGMEMDEIEKSFDLLHVEAFNSEKKQSGVMARKKRDNTVQVHWKGAAEMILAMCSSYYDQQGMLLAGYSRVEGSMSARCSSSGTIMQESRS